MNFPRSFSLMKRLVIMLKTDSLYSANNMTTKSPSETIIGRTLSSVSSSSTSNTRNDQISNKRNKDDSNDDRINEPIHFFGSNAATWKAQKTRSGGSDETLWYQPYVISGSLAIFLIYFCILREENDIDMKLDGKLFDQVEGLEEVQLSLNYKYNKERGLDVTDIERRLQELGVDVNKLT